MVQRRSEGYLNASGNIVPHFHAAATYDGTAIRGYGVPKLEWLRSNRHIARGIAATEASGDAFFNIHIFLKIDIIFSDTEIIINK